MCLWMSCSDAGRCSLGRHWRIGEKNMSQAVHHCKRDFAKDVCVRETMGPKKGSTGVTCLEPSVNHYMRGLLDRFAGIVFRLERLAKNGF